MSTPMREMLSSMPPRADGSSHVELVATHMDVPRGRYPLPFVHDPDSALAATFRVLRHRLRKNGDPRILAVTSPNPREGKTTCAVNLAMALAEHGRQRIALLDTNLRRPRLAEVLGFVQPSCFARQMQPAAPRRGIAAELRARGGSYISRDSASVLQSADVNIVEDVTDGLLITAMAGVTTKGSLRRTAEQLAPAEILGVVLMGA